MAMQEVLREYLVSLRFVSSKQEAKDFTDGVDKVGKVVMSLGKGLIGAGVALAGMVASFASSMDRLYYASQKAASSASNLKALEFAGRQIGMSAEAIDALVGNLMMTLRTDPGMSGWLHSLGVEFDETTQGAEIFVRLMDKLRDQPFYQGAQFAEMVGMSPDQLFQVQANYERFRAGIIERQKMEKDSNLDQDKAAEQGRDLANKLGVVAEKFGIWVDKLISEFLPRMDRITDRLEQIFKIVDKALGWVERLSGSGDKAIDKAAEESTRYSDNPYKPEEHSLISRMARGYVAGTLDFTNRMKGGDGRGPLGQGKTQYADTLDFIERAFNLPQGALSYVMKKESNGNDPRYQLSPKGAAGPFGLMPDTARELGVKDRYDLTDSGIGSAQYLAQLRDKYGGNMQVALQAYNWGPGHMDRYLGAQAQGRNPSMPAETAGYAPNIPARPITINVSGAESPAATAKRIRQELADASADDVRYLKGPQ